MAKATSRDILSLMQFLKDSPTAWHAVENLSKKLLKEGFEQLHESAAWKLQGGGRYFVSRNGSTLCAFTIPHKKPIAARVAGAHTDSPAFKLKPNTEFRKENMIMLGVEVYGAPLLTSWLNRDLGIAGQVAFTDKQGNVKESLVRLDENPVVIPQLAIHLDRNVNENGLTLNKQEHLAALAALDEGSKNKEPYLERLLKQKISCKEILSCELFLYPLEEPRLMGDNGQMLSAYRIDNLNSVHAITTAMLTVENVKGNHMNMAVFWDNEEIGSQTAQGAHSPFFPHLLERVAIALGMTREEYLRLLSQSSSLSVDMAHALHPNYADKHDPRHQPLLNKGIVLKTSAQQRYASDAASSATILSLCHKGKIPVQKFASRGDIPCGTTIGPIHASVTGMPTVDIGCAQLSMHAGRELAGCKDHLEMISLISSYFTYNFTTKL